MGSDFTGEKALMELLFEELICAPERLGFSIPNETHYMIFLITYCLRRGEKCLFQRDIRTQKW